MARSNPSDIPTRPDAPAIGLRRLILPVYLPIVAGTIGIALLLQEQEFFNGHRIVAGADVFFRQADQGIALGQTRESAQGQADVQETGFHGWVFS